MLLRKKVRYNSNCLVIYCLINLGQRLSGPFLKGLEPKISLKFYSDAFPLHIAFYMINQMRNKRFAKGKGEN